jgi:uncharacterized protein YcfL
MRTLTIWTLVLTMLMLSGCATSNVCPPFPKPSSVVVEEIQGLSSKPVDNWMIDLYKLQLKLERCRDE